MAPDALVAEARGVIVTGTPVAETAIESAGKKAMACPWASRSVTVAALPGGPAETGEAAVSDDRVGLTLPGTRRTVAFPLEAPRTDVTLRVATPSESPPKRLNAMAPLEAVT